MYCLWRPTSGWRCSATGSRREFAQKQIGTVYLEAGVSTVRLQHKIVKAVNYSALILDPVDVSADATPPRMPAYGYVISASAAVLTGAGIACVVLFKKEKNSLNDN